MKKLLALALATTVALAASPVVSSAAFRTVIPKTGSTCSPLGKTQVVGAKKFTCVKSGKKLVWNKPTTIAKPTPTPSPVAQPTLDLLDAKAVYDFSRASITEAILKNGSSPLALKYLVGANVSSQTVDDVKADMRRAMDLWGPIFSSTDRLTVIWYVQQDLEWAANTYKSESGNPIEWSNINAGCTINYCGNATATKSQNGSFVFEQGMTLDRNGWNKSTGGHEFTHLAQNKLAGQNINKIPLWLLEGGAQFYGEATGYFPADSSKAIRRGMHGQLAQDAASIVSVNFQNKGLREVLSAGQASSAVQLMKITEFGAWDSSRTALAYLLGSYASEVLVAAYGHEKLVELYKSFEVSSDWEVNFQKVYGLSTTSFYEKLAPYFLQMKDEL